MVRSLSDESQHDGIGRWLDDDEETVQSPRPMPAEDDQDAHKQPLDFASPKEILEWLDIHAQGSETRLVNPAIDVPSVSSVPSLNRSDETMSYSTRSVHEAAEPAADEEAEALDRGDLHTQMPYRYHNHASNAASDSSSDVSGPPSPTSCLSPSDTDITSPSSNGDDQDRSVAFMDDFSENDYDAYSSPPPTMSSPTGLSEWDQYSQPRDGDDDNNEDTRNTAPEEESANSDANKNNATTEANGHDLPQPNDKKRKNEHQQSIRPKNSKKQEESNLRLACPFYKFDSVRHHRCYAHVLTRNSYVKQHLFRSHMQPIHCDICLSEWPSEEKLREHRRAQTCEKKEYIAPEGITPEQERKLRSRLGSQNKSESDQWFDLYSILFPGAQKPKSAYLNAELSEDAESLREFIQGRGTLVLRDKLQNLNQGVDSEGLEQTLQNALSSMFDEWQNQRKAIGGDTIDGRSKRLKSTPGALPFLRGQGRARTDTGSTSTTMTIDDQVESEEVNPITSSPQQE
ncbi:hypothetical protein F53441_10894 [Fusarium austroafricanum]|uniref:C2H2-type domain-containing protein n=1 Tax=Fusarium austroafricanum TaxID=2364996 RepID=A0A8H4K626_9HYPO|nr:hypothetical protein F53441_10894 [Fusarium austroafricanum]